MLYEHSLRLLAHKYFHNDDFSHLLCNRGRLAQSGQFRTPLAMSRRQVNSELASTWNSLPGDVRVNIHEKHAAFKRALKNQLLMSITPTVCTNSNCIQCKSS